MNAMIETDGGVACILQGDTRDVLRKMPDGLAQTCVTSPPYYGLRSYLPEGHEDKHFEIGSEPTPDEYVAEMVAVFREVRRVLRDDGTLWLNIGDSYAKTGKQLLGIPWRVAFALQADGWYLRSAIIWHKPNPMPESIRDRPTSAYEMVFLMTKQERYFYDADAVAEPTLQPIGKPKLTAQHKRAVLQDTASSTLGSNQGSEYRNLRNVWTITPKPFKGAHFATMPIDLAERCILAGSRVGDTVLDPFGGAATTALAALKNGRDAWLAELNPEYIKIAEQRLNDAQADISKAALALLSA
jgi:DNA modification methylase